MCALVTGVQTCALPISRRDTERVQRRRAVGDADVRKVDRTFADDARRARRDRLVDEFVPVGRLALHRDEEIALRHLARVEGDALHGEVGAGGAARGVGDGARGPQRVHAASSRATVTSSKGMMRMASPRPTICPCSWPLPAMQTMSSARASAITAAIAARRSPITRAPRSEEHTSELQSLMRTSYAVFC